MKKLFVYIGVFSLFLLCSSFLFYGMIFPTNEFIGCYINREKTKKICINSDKSFEQFLRTDTVDWKKYGQSVWSDVKSKDKKDKYIILWIDTVSRIQGGELITNVVIQPYKDLIGRVQFTTTINEDDFDEGEFFFKEKT